jgi:hypothetical protein
MNTVHDKQVWWQLLLEIDAAFGKLSAAWHLPKKGSKYYIAFTLLTSLGVYLQGECEESTGTNSSEKASWLDTLLNTYMNKSKHLQMQSTSTIWQFDFIYFHKFPSPWAYTSQLHASFQSHNTNFKQLEYQLHKVELLNWITEWNLEVVRIHISIPQIRQEMPLGCARPMKIFQLPMFSRMIPMRYNNR